MNRQDILAIAKPILFSTEMTRAVLDNSKTVTRRVIKPHNKVKANKLEYTQGNGLWVEDGYIKDYSVSPCWVKIEDYIKNIYKYQVGDYLYVRETWNSILLHDKNDKFYVFKSTYDYNNKNEMKWRPSIHMPKEAARIFLRVTDIRVERLQDITISQMTSEGIDNTMPSTDCEELCNYCPIPNESKGVHCYGGNPVMCEGRCCSEAFEIWVNIFTDEFASLWDSTIEKQDLDKYGWNANPCVWVIEFERVSSE